MANTDTWNAAFEASPADGDDIGEGAERIRDAKVAIRERMAIDHYFAIDGTDADHGEHTKITFHAPISTPTNVANKGFLYLKDVDEKAELHFEDEDGNEIQLTSEGALKVTLPEATSLAELGITATANEINTVCDGSTAKNNHVHAVAAITSGSITGITTFGIEDYNWVSGGTAQVCTVTFRGKTGSGGGAALYLAEGSYYRAYFSTSAESAYLGFKNNLYFYSGVNGSAGSNVGKMNSDGDLYINKLYPGDQTTGFLVVVGASLMFWNGSDYKTVAFE